MIIDQLIQERVRQQEAQRQAEIAQATGVAKDKMAILRREFAEWAGPAFAELEPFVSGITYVNSEQVPTGEVSLELRAISLRLCPAQIHRGFRREWQVTFQGSAPISYGLFADFAFGARSRFADWLDERVAALKRHYLIQTDPGRAEAMRELVELSPQEATAVEMEAQRRQGAVGLKKKADEQREQAVQQAVQEYRIAWADYWPKRVRIQEANKTVIARWRELLSGGFEVTDVEVGIVATDEYGTQRVSTKIESTLGKTPTDDYWRVLRGNGLIEEWSFTSVVGVARPRVVLIGDDGLSGCIYVGDIDRHGVHTVLAVAPGADCSALRRQIESELAELPTPPQANGMLTQWQKDAIENDLCNGVSVQDSSVQDSIVF